MVGVNAPGRRQLFTNRADDPAVKVERAPVVACGKHVEGDEEEFSRTA